MYGADGFGDMFIWSHTELFYSPNGGTHTHNIELVYAVISGVTVTALSVNVQSEDSDLLNSVQWNSGEYIKQTASGMRYTTDHMQNLLCVCVVCVQVGEGSLLC